MKKISIDTEVKKLLGDLYTPIGIYLRLRDRFRDTILLESTDFHAGDNSYSFIGVNAIAGIEINNPGQLEFKLPGQEPKKEAMADVKDVPARLNAFMDHFSAGGNDSKEAKFAQGLYGYSTYDAVQFFETIKLKPAGAGEQIPLMRYRLYQYIIVFNHFKDELFICENRINGIESEVSMVESLIKSKDVPVYPFALAGKENASITDDAYLEMVQKGIKSCLRGDVFQIVLSRRFEQGFTGDEFNVYRALRSINPSPYLFFLDYGDYKLMGSSPEAQLIVAKGKATVHPIAGTFRRTGDEAFDAAETQRLLKDEKENAEHVMLVDLARNDLSRVCSNVAVTSYRQVHYYSHVIHLVSEVQGDVTAGSNPFELLSKTFPAGTLSGAPKFRAMQLIDEFETTARGFYGGTIGFAGFDGSFNHAIMIRSMLCRNNTLVYQAGAGVVAASKPENELAEVNNKLGALKSAIRMAGDIR